MLCSFNASPKVSKDCPYSDKGSSSFRGSLSGSLFSSREGSYRMGFTPTFKGRVFFLFNLLPRSEERGWFLSSFIQKVAYFHVPIVPHHRKVLRFSFKNQVYQFMVLPFGLSLALSCLHKVHDRISISAVVQRDANPALFRLLAAVCSTRQQDIG